MQKAAIAWPFWRARGMSSRTRRQSAASLAWVTILTTAGASAVHAPSFAWRNLAGGVPEKSCQEQINFVALPASAERSLAFRAGSVAASIST